MTEEQAAIIREVLEEVYDLIREGDESEGYKSIWIPKIKEALKLVEEEDGDYDD